jgi:transposase
MKITRSSKCYFKKFITKKKQEQLELVMKEYSKIVNKFIGKYQWKISNKKTKRDKKTQFDLCYKDYIHSVDTWLSARLIKNAFREGYGMVQSAKSNATTRKEYYRRPVHYGSKMILSETIATAEFNPKTKEFDLLVSLGSIGNKIKIIIPLKKNNHFNEFNNDKTWIISKSITITNKYIQFSFEKEIQKKDISDIEELRKGKFADKYKSMQNNLITFEKDTPEFIEQRNNIYNYINTTMQDNKIIGLDCGINKLLASTDNKTFGEGYKMLLEKLLRKKQKSKAWYRCKEEIREYIDYNIKNLNYNLYNLLVVEDLDNVHKNMKLKLRLSKNMRRLVSKWTFRYIYERLFAYCDLNRVRYRQVKSFNNSRTCPICNYTNQKNRKVQSDFCCLECGYSDNADYSASKRAVIRYLSWKPTVSNPKQINEEKLLYNFV